MFGWEDVGISSFDGTMTVVHRRDRHLKVTEIHTKEGVKNGDYVLVGRDVAMVGKRLLTGIEYYPAKGRDWILLRHPQLALPFAGPATKAKWLDAKGQSVRIYRIDISRLYD